VRDFRATLRFDAWVIALYAIERDYWAAILCTALLMLCVIATLVDRKL
jgi:hypothetical protein